MRAAGSTSIERGPGGIAARPAGQQLARRHVPVVEADDGVRADRQVDDAGPWPRSRRAGAPRPAPADDHRRSPLAPSPGLVRRPRPDDRPEVDLGRRDRRGPRSGPPCAGRGPAGWRSRGRASRRPGSRRSQAGHRSATRDGGATGSASGSRRMRVEPQQRIAAGLGTKSDIPTWLPPYVPGMIVSDPGLAGRGVPARPLGGMRSAPVEDLVLEMRDRGERAGAPAEDALVDLEPAPDEPASSPRPDRSTTV